MLILKSPFDKKWGKSNPFEEINKIDGIACRKVDKRSTLNFRSNEESFYIKIHEGVSFKEILKNVVCLRWPVIGARNEYQAISRLHELGINTMDVAAFGEKGVNPLTKKSFIITRDLNPAISLEDFCENWKNIKPDYLVKKRLIEEVASMIGKMHRGGVNHRDCYICHFLLKLPYEDASSPNLYVIDLHRAQIRNQVPIRWRNKDLIALYFSTLNIGLTNVDYLRFLKVYFQGKRLKAIFRDEEAFLKTLDKKANKILERTVRRGL